MSFYDVDRTNPVNLSSPLNRELEHWWLGLGDAGLTWRDVVGQAHGALSAGAVFSGYQNGLPRMLCDRTDNQADCGLVDMVLWTTGITISVWVNYDGSGTAEHSICGNFESEFKGNFLLRIEPATDSIEFFVTEENNQLRNANFTDLVLTVDKLHHIVCTVHDGALRGYLDAVVSSTTTAHGGIIERDNSTNSFMIGRTPHNTTDDFGGFISDVRMFSRGMSGSEVIAQRNQGLRQHPNTLNRHPITYFIPPAAAARRIFVVS